MLRSSLCDYNDAYILAKGNITVNNTAGAGAATNNTNKNVVFKHCAPYANCIIKINNIQIDNDKYIDTVMPMYNLIKYIDNYSKTSRSVWQYCKEIPILLILTEPMLLIHLILKQKITGQTDNNGRIDNVEIMVPLKYLSNFWRTLKMSLINCEVQLILTWSADCIIIYTDVANQKPTFTIIETNLGVPAVTLSTLDNAKLLPQLKSGFKRTINWNKYLRKPELLSQNPNLNLLVEPSFQGVNRLFVLAFEDNEQRTSNKGYYIPNVEIKDYSVLIEPFCF